MTEFNKKEIEEFKTIKSIFDRASKFFENNKIAEGEYLEKKASFNCKILSKQFNLDYDIIIDLVFDYEYTINKLNA